MLENRVTIDIRLVCLNPPPLEDDGSPAEFGVQDKDGELLAGSARADGALVYSFRIDALIDSDYPNFLGPYTHGTPMGRFVYLGYRRPGSRDWIKRIKVRLGSITRAQVEEAVRDGRVIEGTVDASGAGVVRLTDGWTVR